MLWATALIEAPSRLATSTLLDFHDLRHSGAVLATAMGASLGELMDPSDTAHQAALQYSTSPRTGIAKSPPCVPNWPTAVHVFTQSWQVLSIVITSPLRRAGGFHESCAVFSRTSTPALAL